MAAHIGEGPIAIFPWGEVIEEFLDPLGLTIRDFAARMRGGWLFGYVAGLKACGREAIVVCASEGIRQTTRLTHAETGAPIWVAPGRRSGGGLTQGLPSIKAAAQWARTPYREFARVLRDEHCSAILAQDYEHPRFDALALLAHMLRLPLYATFQGGDVTLSPLEARVRQKSLRTCRAIAVASARERERLARDYALGDVIVADIPNPVDAEFWRAEPREAARRTLGLATDQFILINHGRIDIQRKGLDVLLQAWRGFVREGWRARLVVIESGQDWRDFPALLADVPNVTWMSDYVTDPLLIRRWLSAADAYASLSRLEGMPVAPLEAMACGLPVLASDAHGLADIFRDGEASGGIVVPRGEVEPAQRGIARLAEDSELRARLGAAARTRVEAHYATDAVGLALSRLVRPGAAVRAPAAVVSRNSLHSADIR